jgi:hypothetical protein
MERWTGRTWRWIEGKTLSLLRRDAGASDGALEPSDVTLDASNEALAPSNVTSDFPMERWTDPTWRWIEGKTLSLLPT